jgi:hypothetical protein
MNIGYFGLLTSFGIGLVNRCGEFIELASDKYVSIRAPFLKECAERIANGKAFTQTIWDVIGKDRIY